MDRRALLLTASARLARQATQNRFWAYRARKFFITFDEPTDTLIAGELTDIARHCDKLIEALGYLNNRLKQPDKPADPFARDDDTPY